VKEKEMSPRSVRRAALACLAIALIVFAARLTSAPKKERDYYEYFDELAKVIDQIENNYVEEADQQKLFQGAIQGMLHELDPYSAYIPPDMFRIFQEDTQGYFGGLGITIGIQDDLLTVISPLEGTPAARAGILPGDKILRIDGESTENMSLLDAVNKLRGDPGTTVTMTIRHRGADDDVDVTMTRERIEIHSVRGYRRLADGQGWDYWVQAEEKIAYVRLSAFQENTVAELDEAVKKVVADGARGLVLDLRSNPGGLLDSAVAVSDRFLRDGVIVSIRGRTVGTKEHRAHASDDYPENLLVAVLVNRYSASGSEIVAGALQDHGRAVLIGEETFGKGSVQNIIPLKDDNSAIKLTTAKYYTPSGRSFERDPKTKKGGLVPDITIPFTNEQLRQMHQQWQMLSIDLKEAPKPEVSKEEPFVDTQLQRAVDLLVGLHVVRASGG
jgi:carboxyl-terminal processing protease